jgi:sugar/nucleoside kinase (ribokinase family)
VFKQGASGGCVGIRDCIGASTPAIQAKAINKTGAGDAFNGALATGLMVGTNPMEGVQYASVAAANFVSWNRFTSIHGLA